MLATSQWQRIGGYTYKQLNPYMVALREGGYMTSELTPVEILGTAPPNLTPKERGLYWGRTEYLNLITPKGLQILVSAGLITKGRHIPEFDSKNTLFIRHEMSVRSVRVRLAEHARFYSAHSVEDWRDGPNAWVRTPSGEIGMKPDASFLYDLPESQLFCFVEVDRDTERRIDWEDKASQYDPMLTETRVLSALTGHDAAFVLVTVPHKKRREEIAEFVSPYRGSQRYRIAILEEMTSAPLDAPIWRVPGMPDLAPLVPTDYL